MDIIQVSSATLKGLSGLSSVPKESLAKVCKYFLQVLIKGSSNVALDESLDEPLSSISTILLEAAKSDATTEQLRYGDRYFYSGRLDRPNPNCTAKLFSRTMQPTLSIVRSDFYFI